MNKRLPAILRVWPLALAISGCDDGSTAEPDATLSGQDSGPGDDAAPDAPDAAPDSEPADTSSDDVRDTRPTDTDAADAVDDTVDAASGPDCTPPERAVGTLCRKPFDRACITDANCRPEEVCVWGPDDERDGTCIYTPAEPQTCPGASGCTNASGSLRAGFSLRDVTPQGWEMARPGYSENFDALGLPKRFVGDATDPATFCDCGRDMICPPTDAYVDCRSVGTWLGPDEDGTEEDGLMQGNWMAGFNEGRNASFCPAALLGPDCEGDACCASPAAHDPIWVRGGVLEQGDVRVAILSVDTVGYFYNDIQRHFDALPEALGIDHILMMSTHNHQGPDAMGRWGPGFLGASLPTDSGRVPAWLDEVHEAVIAVITESVERLEPVDVYAARFRTPRDEFALRDSRDPYIAADVATVIRVVADGEAPSASSTRGVWLNWHNHAESVGDDSRIVSSDFPHYLRDALENGLPAGDDPESVPAVDPVGGTAMYIAGAVGGLMTPLGATVLGRDGVPHEEDGFTKARLLGERLAASAARALSAPCAPEDAYDCYTRVEESLAFSTVEVLLPLQNVNFQTGAIDLDLFQRPVFNWRRSDGSGLNSDKLPNLLTALTQLRLGAVTWQTIPGEAFPETFTGFDPAEAAAYAQVGDVRDPTCGPDGRSHDTGDTPCLNDRDNDAPPALDLAPDGPGLFDSMPGGYDVVVGNGMDALGYFIPSYDFVVHPTFGTLVSMPGDHYEEEVSVGDALPTLLSAVGELTDALDAD